jgi:hypothetical protein
MHGAEIDQATGMVTEKQGVGIAEAFVRLRAHAYAHHRRLGRSGPRCHGAPRVAEPGSGRTRGLPGVRTRRRHPARRIPCMGRKASVYS